jgi:putative DNA primase/helicase
MSCTTHGKLDKEEIKAAANGRWPEILTAVCGWDSDILDGRHHPCPRCGGNDRFRLIDIPAGAVLCSHCFSEDNGDGFAAVMWDRQCTFPAALQLVADALGIRGTSHPNNRHHDTDLLQNSVISSPPTGIVEAMARAKRVPLPSWLAFGAHEAQRGKLTVCRMPMYDTHGNQCSYCDFADISPEFLKGMSAKGQPVGLYYAMKPKPGDMVLITEGPKDASALHSLGFIAVGMPTCKLATKFARMFVGCHAVFVPDLDAAGEDSAPINASRLKGGAASVRIARLPGEMKKTDGDGVREILAQADGEQLVRQAIADAVPWEPAAQDEDGPPPVDGYEWTSLKTDQGRTDRANSRRLLAAHGDKIRYCHPWGKWLVWDGTRWRIDDDGAVMRLAMSVADSVWMDAKGCLTKEVADFAVKTSGRGSLKAMLELAAADVPVSVADLDANPWLLNCTNGTVDLRTGKLAAHRPEDNLTKICPTRFNPEAQSYHWDKFLDGVFGGDDLIIQFVQRLAGYCATGDVSEQILAVFFGTGSNGKSTLLNAVQNTLGTDYTAAAPPALLMEKKTETHPTELAGLFGKRFVIAQETNQGARLAESTVKQLTGGDMISARRMREDFWTFAPTHKLGICTNNRPRVRGSDHGIWRRLVLIPFERRFWNPAKGETGPDDLRQDKDLPARLAAEAEGILSWMVRGCLDWQRGGLRIPDSVRAATEEYRTEQDVLGRFVAECCLFGQVYRVKFSDLYTRLENWCKDSGDNLPSKTFVGEWLKNAGYQDRHSGCRWYLEIGLKNETD